MTDSDERRRPAIMINHQAIAAAREIFAEQARLRARLDDVQRQLDYAVQTNVGLAQDFHELWTIQRDRFRAALSMFDEDPDGARAIIEGQLSIIEREIGCRQAVKQ